MLRAAHPHTPTHTTQWWPSFDRTFFTNVVPSPAGACILNSANSNLFAASALACARCVARGGGCGRSHAHPSRARWCRAWASPAPRPPPSRRAPAAPACPRRAARICRPHGRAHHQRLEHRAVEAKPSQRDARQRAASNQTTNKQTSRQTNTYTKSVLVVDQQVRIKLQHAARMCTHDVRTVGMPEGVTTARSEPPVEARSARATRW